MLEASLKMIRATLALLLLFSVAVISTENEEEREERSFDSDLVAAADTSADLQLREVREISELRPERQVILDLSHVARESRGIKSWIKGLWNKTKNWGKNVKKKFRKFKEKIRRRNKKKKAKKERKRKEKERARKRKERERARKILEESDD